MVPMGLKSRQGDSRFAFLAVLTSSGFGSAMVGFITRNSFGPSPVPVITFRPITHAF
jgi:hypothetical protein